MTREMAFTNTALPLCGASFSTTSVLTIQRHRFATTVHRRTRAKFHCLTSSSSSSSSSSTVDNVETKEQLVDKLLVSIQDFDGGPQTSKPKREEIDETINRIIAIGDNSGVNYLVDPLIHGKYCVAYTGGGRGNSAAGGAFRSRIGRLFFVPRGAFQHIFKPDIAINLVAFRLFGFIGGAVGLYGAFQTIDDMGKGGLRVKFWRPRIRIGPWTFVFSNESEVKLRIAYLDERVRIAVGGRGSLFVFTRGGVADGAIGDEWKLLFGDNVRVKSQNSFQLFIGIVIGVLGGVLVSIITNLVEFFMR